MNAPPGPGEARSPAPSPPLARCTVVVTPRSFGAEGPDLRRELELAVGRVHYQPGPLAAAALAEAVAGADGLLAGLDDVNAEVLAGAPRLRVVARYGVGVDRVDLEAAARLAITVTNTPGANANAVAELTVGLLFVLARPVIAGRERARAGEWPAMRGQELSGKTLGLLGLGRIGALVAAKASALGMRVLACDPYVPGTAASGVGAVMVDRDRLCAEADFLSLHTPLTTETRRLVDRPFLAGLKPGVALVNTARGELVDEGALLWALDGGLVRAAALDVLGREPPPPDHPLFGRDDVIITPHIAPHTAEATAAMGRMALDDLLAVLSGRPPRFPVTPRPDGQGKEQPDGPGEKQEV